MRYVLRSLALLVLLSMGASVRAQSVDWDLGSLDRDYAQATTDTGRMYRSEQMVWAYIFSPKSLRYIHQADSIADRLITSPDSTIAREALLMKGRLRYKRGYYHKFRRDLPQAMRDFRASEEIAARADDTYAIANSCDAIGVCFQALGMPQQALESFDRELDLLLTIRSTQDAAAHRGMLHRTGALVRLGRFADAETQLRKPRPYLTSDKAFLHMQWADLLQHKGDTAGALLRTDSAMALLPELIGWDDIPVLEPTARLRLQAGFAESALSMAIECVAVAERTVDEGAWCGCNVLAAEAMLVLGRKKEAEEKLRAVLDRARANGYVGLSREIGDDGSMVRAAEELKDLYKSQGRTAEALAMTEYWTRLKDSVAAIEARDELFRFELQQAAFTDSVADALRVEEATLSLRTTLESERANRRLAIGLGIGAAIVGLLVTLFLLNRRKQERMLVEHDMRRARDEHMIRDLHMREQMSEDLHEELGAGLSALKLWSEMDLAEESDPQRKQLLEKRGAMADELVASLRQIIWALNSPSTTLKQLVDYLADFAHLHCAQYGLRLQVEVGKDWPVIALRPEQRRLPFLAVKESLMNTVKHADAQCVELRISWEDALVIDLRDDGKGSTGPPDKLPGNGLRTMRRRITSLGGELLLDGANGMHVRIHIPITAA